MHLVFLGLLPSLLSPKAASIALNKYDVLKTIIRGSQVPTKPFEFLLCLAWMLLLWSRWVLFDYLVSSIINLWEGHHQWFDLQRITITKPSRASSAVKVVRAISLYPSLLVSRSVSTMLSSSSKRFWHSNNFFPSFVSLQCHSSPWRR